MRKLFLSSLPLLFMFSCHLFDSDSGVHGSIKYSSDTSETSSQSYTTFASESESTEDSFISEYYDDYGTLVDTITPTSFIQPIDMAQLSCEGASVHVVNPTPGYDSEADELIIPYADYTSSIQSESDEYLQTGYFYNNFLFGYGASVGRVTTTINGVEKAGYKKSVVVLDLPDEYGGVINIHDEIATDSDGTVMTAEGETIYTSRVLDEEKAIYQVTLDYLIPNESTDGSFIVPCFWFSGDEVIIYEFPDGQSEHSLSDYADSSLQTDMTVSGGDFVRLPFDGIMIDSDATSVLFEMNWDLTDIVEIYDNNTPSDLSDDILVLADRFWERIELTATVN